MNPASKTAAATIHQVGRRLSSSFAANSSRNGMGRVADLIGSARSNHSDEAKNQMLAARTGSPLVNSSQQIIQLLSSQRRSKSSMAMAYDEVADSAPATATYDQSVREPFPSIVLGPDKAVEPQGSFAEAQAEVRIEYLIVVNMR